MPHGREAVAAATSTAQEGEDPTWPAVPSWPPGGMDTGTPRALLPVCFCASGTTKAGASCRGLCSWETLVRTESRPSGCPPFLCVSFLPTCGPGWRSVMWAPSARAGVFTLSSGAALADSPRGRESGTREPPSRSLEGRGKGKRGTCVGGRRFPSLWA